jgi:signal transduction histidine kinase
MNQGVAGLNFQSPPPDRGSKKAISAVTHDLRNALAAVCAGTQLIERTQLDAETRMIVELMRKDAGHAIALVDDLMQAITSGRDER